MDNISVLELVQNFYFSAHNPPAVLVLIFRLLEAFNRYYLSRFSLNSFKNRAVGSFAYKRNNFVRIHT